MLHLSRATTLIWFLTGIGLVLRLFRYLHAGARTGVTGYDDGVYFGAAVRLVHGSLPYRDFVFVHPPVITELFAPLVALSPHVSTVTLVFLGRLLTAVVSAATIALVGLLLRERGAVAVAVGCGLLAVHDTAVGVTRGTLIEPYLAFFFVLGLVLLFDASTVAGPRRTFWAGVVLGIAVATKLWAAVPVAVLLVLLVRDRSRLWRLGAGVVLGAVVPCLPFLFTAPGTFFRDVVESQITRSAGRVPINTRLADLLGLNGFTASRDTIVLVVGVALAVLLVAGYAHYFRTVGRPTVFDVAVVGCTIATVLMFLVPNEFYWHYGGFFAPFLALAVALPAGHLVTSRNRRASAVWYGVGALVLAVCLISCLVNLATPRWTRVDVSAVDAAVRPGSCVLINDSSLALAVDRMPTSRSCRIVVDAVGTAFVESHGRQGRHARGAPALQRVWLRAAHGARFVLFNRAWLRLVPIHVVHRYLRRRFHPVASGDRHVLIWARTAVKP